MNDKEIIEAYRIVVEEQNKVIESLNQVIGSLTSYVHAQFYTPKTVGEQLKEQLERDK